MPQTASMSSSTTTRHASRRCVRVIMLDRHELIIKIENKSARVAEVFSQVCQLTELRETDYFGLALFQDNEFHFVLNDTKLQKLAPKVWKSKDCSVDEPLLTFHFRVQYYVDNIGLLKEKATRLQYYLQLRDNLLHYNQSVSEEKCFLLAGLALQADFGNFDQGRHVGAYFDPREFFPAWVMIRRGQDYITSHLPSVHRDMAGVSPPDARVQYIRDLSEPPAAHNMHFYRLRRRKYDPVPGNDWLAICPKGLEVYEESSDNFKNLLSTFLWSNIGKLSCEKKKFEIVAEGLAERRFVYYASSKESGERLLDMCRVSHRFQLSRQAQLSELKRLEEHDRWGVRHHEKYVYSENTDSSSLDMRRVQHAVGGHELLTPVTGGSDRRMPSALRRSKNAIRAVSSPPSASTPVTVSEETRLKEIIIDTPPQVTPGSFSLTNVTPIVGQSTVWTSPSYDVSSGIDNLLNSDIQRDQLQIHHIQQQIQPLFITSPYSCTPQQSGALAVGVSRGSFIRSSASSTEGSLIVTSGSVSRAPQSILKQPAASLHCDFAANSSVPSAVPVMAPDSQGSAPTGGTSINAKSLQRKMPPGADLNDVISRMLTGKSVAAVQQQSATPIRKSSLVSTHLGPSPSADVTRSTSLRQPTKTDAEEWLPLRHGFATQVDLSSSPLPVEAHFQRVPFASPMTVTSNPVHSAAPSPGRMTPPAYQPPPTYSHATNVEQPIFLTPSQSQPPHSNHFHAAPTVRPQHDAVWPSPLTVQNHGIGGDQRMYFDYLASDISGSSTVHLEPAANGVYRLVQVQHPDTVESQSTQLQQADAEESQMVCVAAGKPVAPPSYQVAKSLKMNAVSVTPPNTRRYFEDIDPSQQARFTNQSNCISALASPASMDCTNGDGRMQVSYGATPLRMTNGQHEPVANGPMTYVCTASTKPTGVAVTHSANAVPNRQLRVPVRQSSCASTDSNGMTASQCPQHGSGVNIVDLIKDNIGARPAPMLKALCNDPSLRSGCTCSHTDDMTQRTSPTSGTPSYTSVRRLSLTQPLSTWEQYDQPGTVARPYSWASESGSGQIFTPQLAEVDANAISHPNPVELVNGGLALRSGLGLVHQNPDSATCQTVYGNRERIMANH